ncbi:MAG: hypothetical protein IT289_06590 [Oligoflexia bacterium]|nr:hypothetical protein [Oligoflexia bacterium]
MSSEKGSSPDNPIKIGDAEGVGIPRIVQPKVDSAACESSPRYVTLRQELGEIVNRISSKDASKKIKALEEFRLTRGLPIPVGISMTELKGQKLVFSCRPACGEMVHLMFVSDIDGTEQLKVLAENGELRSLHRSRDGVELLILDELNKKGVPFKSWILPMADGPFFLLEDAIHYPLDVFGYSLESSERGRWRVVKANPLARPLTPVDAAQIRGCDVGSRCWVVQQGKNTRYFKSARVCD